MNPTTITIRMELPDGTFNEMKVTAPDEVGFYLIEKAMRWKDNFAFTPNEIDVYFKKLEPCNNPK